MFSTNCHYCEAPPVLDNRKLVRNGIDRVDSSKGYVTDNVVPCCRDCNVAKSDLSKAEFLNLVEKIYNHSIKGASLG
jgi:hypothetical protein